MRGCGGWRLLHFLASSASVDGDLLLTSSTYVDGDLLHTAASKKWTSQSYRDEVLVTAALAGPQLSEVSQLRTVALKTSFAHPL